MRLVQAGEACLAVQVPLLEDCNEDLCLANLLLSRQAPGQDLGWKPRTQGYQLQAYCRGSIEHQCRQLSLHRDP